MNKNSIIGFVLIAIIMIGYTLWISPSEEELARQQAIQDSIARVEQNNAEINRIAQEERQRQQSGQTQMEGLTANQDVSTENISADYQELKSQFAAFANSAVGEENSYIIETELLKLEISNKGGFVKNVEIKGYQTYDSLPLILFDSDHTGFGISFFAQNRAINTENF